MREQPQDDPQEPGCCWGLTQPLGFAWLQLPDVLPTSGTSTSVLLSCWEGRQVSMGISFSERWTGSVHLQEKFLLQ